MSETVGYPAVALRRLFAVVSGATPDSQNQEFWNGEVTWVTPEDLSGRSSPDIASSRRTLTRSGYESCGTSLVPSGSIVLSTRAPIGNVGVAATPLCTNQGCKSLVPLSAETNTRFFFYQLSVLTRELNRLGKGTTFLELSANELAAFKVSAPPPDLQERVANFLDEQTSRIDALIAEKERLLELLAEHRLSVCERVLANTSDRGRAKLGFHVDLLPGFAFPSDEFSRDPDDVPLLRGINVSPAGLRWDETVYWTRDYDPSLERFRVKAGDVVFGMDRPWIASGTRVAMVSPEHEGVLLLQRVCRLRGGDKLRQRFIYYALASDMFRQSIEVDLTGVSVPHISPEQILRFQVPVLSLDEQDERCAEADQEDKRIRELEVQTGRLLERLREYRSSLISAAVTGQLNVSSYERQPERLVA